MNSQWILPALMLAGVVVVPVLLVIWITRRRARSTQSLEVEADYVNAGLEPKTSRIHGGRLVTGKLQGTPFTIEVVPLNKNSPPTAVLKIPCALDGGFTITSEDASDRYFKRIGLTSELQIGDADFDREVYFESGSPDYLKAVFGQPGARESVRALFRLGYDTVVLGRGVLRACQTGREHLPALDGLRCALEQLAALGATPGVPSGAGTAWQAYGAILVVLTWVALVFGGLALAMAGISRTQSLLHGQLDMIRQVWLGFTVVYIALNVLAYRLLRGRPTAPAEISVALFLVLPSLGLGAWGGAMLANQYLDESVARERFTKGGRPNSIRRGGERRYFVEIAPLNSEGRHVEIEISEAYRNARPGQRWVVRTRSGWLGFEWVESARPVPDG